MFLPVQGCFAGPVDTHRDPVRFLDRQSAPRVRHVPQVAAIAILRGVDVVQILLDPREKAEDMEEEAYTSHLIHVGVRVRSMGQSES